MRAEMKTESIAVKDKLQAAEQAVTAVLGDIQRMESARRHRQQAVERLRVECKDCAYAASRAEESLGVKEKTAATIRATVDGLKAQAEDMRNEIGTSLDAKLTPAETKELGELNPRLDKLKEEVLAAAAARLAAEAELGELKATLESNLERRQLQIEATTSEVDMAGAEADLARAEAEAAAAAAEEAVASARHRELSAKVDEANSEVQECKSTLDRLRNERDDTKAGLADDEREMEGSDGKARHIADEARGAPAQDPRARLVALRCVRAVPRKSAQDAALAARKDQRTALEARPRQQEGAGSVPAVHRAARGDGNAAQS